MPARIGNCWIATLFSSCINHSSRPDTPPTQPEMSVWEKIKEYLCPTHQSEALELIRTICHPAAGTTRQDVAGKFEQLRTLAYSGFYENIQSGRHGDNHFCILDANNQEMLSVTLDDAGMYTVKCQGYDETHNLTMGYEPGEEYAARAEGGSGTLRATHAHITTPPQAAEDYEAVWSTWERDAPPDEATNRVDVVKILRKIQKHNSHTLKLVNLNITSLPDHLPSCIKCLYIEEIPLTSLPTLPDGLTSLGVLHTKLTSLPVLPDGLKSLGMYHTPLTSLPVLSDSLSDMSIVATHLTSLPDLPDKLERLYIIDTPSLTSLPVLPRRLSTLRVESTSITTLPANIIDLSRHANVDISNSPLSRHTYQSLRGTMSARGYSGPAIRISMDRPSVPQEPLPLHQEVADWLTKVKKGEPAPADRWKDFEKEDNAASFSSFLGQLSEVENSKKGSGFKAQIAPWLTQLAEDDGLRAKTFAMATEATSSCEDRVTLALNQMKNVQLEHNAEKGVYDNNLPELVSAGREMFRLEKLEQIARQKVNTMHKFDEIEVYLGYQTKLRKPLELSTVAKKMLFFRDSKITKSDLRAAILQVRTAEDSQFKEWILKWAPLRSVLERREPIRWEALREKKISDYDNTYQMLSDTELKPAGLVGDADAERAIGTKAMESMEKAFIEGLRPLAEDMLGKYLNARWS